MTGYFNINDLINMHFKLPFMQDINMSIQVKLVVNTRVKLTQFARLPYDDKYQNTLNFIYRSFPVKNSQVTTQHNCKRRVTLCREC